MNSRRIACALVIGLAAVGALSTRITSVLAAGVGAQAPTVRTIYASVVDKDGTPVTDLTAADFEVKEGGKTQEITSVKLATIPRRIHVIVSDAGTGAFQLGVLRFAQALVGNAEFAITSVQVQPTRVLDYTGNGQLIGPGIEKIGRRGTVSAGNQLMDAMRNALEDLAAPGRHPVLVVLRVGNEDPSSMRANALREALRMSGATMYVVSRTGASKAAPTYAGAAGMSAEVAQRQMDDAELADAALNLNLVLGDGSKDSGGYQQEISLTTAEATMQQLAEEIKNQYEITYVLPAGTKPSDKVQVTTKRKGVTLRAPQKIAN